MHMVKDDWPWWRLLHERPFTRGGNYLFTYFKQSQFLDIFTNEINDSILQSILCLA